MKHVIRQYEESDLEDVLSSWENASKIAHPFLDEEFLETERHNIPNLYLPNADTWVAEVDGKVLGFISLIGNEVGAIFLDPKSQGIGIGRSLMDKAKEIHGTLEVQVFKDNSIGRKFYDRYGFKYLAESIHEATNQQVLRLKFVPH